MKTGYTHVCFVIDESGSMYSSASDVNGGVKRVIDEQKAVKDGSCSISLFTFDTYVKEWYIGKDVNEIPEYVFKAGSLTALNDGVGTAIDRIGNWLNSMPEEDRPEKNLIVIITDGYENASTEYTQSRIKEMIKHQEDKYNWSFMYIGADLTSTEQADNLGIKSQGYSTRGSLGKSFEYISTINKAYRCCNDDTITKNAMFDAMLCDTVTNMNAEYAAETNINLNANDSKLGIKSEESN